jgi:hypothetical protein
VAFGGLILLSQQQQLTLKVTSCYSIIDTLKMTEWPQQQPPNLAFQSSTPPAPREIDDVA